MGRVRPLGFRPSSRHDGGQGAGGEAPAAERADHHAGPDQVGRCRVEAIPNKQKPGSNLGYVVRDAENRPVRQFVSYDDKTFNIVAFYVNGVEAYREVYPPNPAEPNQFRWLGPNGGKWGLDKDKDGKVDEWVVISPEEVSQELLAAVMTKDAKRLDALLPTKEQLTGAGGLPPAEADRIRERAAKAAQKLTEAADALKLSPEAKWGHLELGVPQTTPADAFGGRDDLVVHKNGTILILDGDKTKLLQVGELIQIGRAWKVVEGPGAGPGGADAVGPTASNVPVITPEIADFVKRLDDLDKTAGTLATPEALAGYYAKRVEILEQIVQKLPPEKQADWLRLLVDSLTASAEGGKPENPAHARLKQLKEVLAKGAPGNPLVAYLAFRLLSVENAMAMKDATTGEKIGLMQERWRAGLEEYIKLYQTSEDAPEATIRLAMAWEFAGKDKDGEAKTWCEFLIKNYPQHHHAAKAAGVIRRLECEGKLLQVQGTILATGQEFKPGLLAGKAIVVYYWASWSSTLADDAKKLKDLATTYGPKGLEIVTVCLDDDAKVAGQTIQSLQLPGHHLHMKGGIDSSPLAAQYGIHVPPHFLLVGKDSKVTNKNGQAATLEDEVKKLTQ